MLPPRNLLLCTDEEGGAYPGIRYLAEQGMIEGHLLSFNGTAAARIWAGCFGSMDLRIGVEGRAAHSGEGDGVNAIDAALPVLNALHALKARVGGAGFGAAGSDRGVARTAERDGGARG